MWITPEDLEEKLAFARDNGYRQGREYADRKVNRIEQENESLMSRLQRTETLLNSSYNHNLLLQKKYDDLKERFKEPAL